MKGLSRTMYLSKLVDRFYKLKPEGINIHTKCVLFFCVSAFTLAFMLYSPSCTGIR